MFTHHTNIDVQIPIKISNQIRHVYITNGEGENGYHYVESMDSTICSKLAPKATQHQCVKVYLGRIDDKHIRKQVFVAPP
jgi:hypothetical protein